MYLCSSCPRGDTDTTNVNKVIKTLAVVYGGSYVGAYSAFYDNNNGLRTKFYKPRDWIIYQTRVFKRLPGTINLVLPIADNLKFCVYQQVSENKPEMANLHKVRNLIPKMTMIIIDMEVHLNIPTNMDNTLTETRIMDNTKTEMKIINTL